MRTSRCWVALLEIAGHPVGARKCRLQRELGESRAVIGAGDEIPVRAQEVPIERDGPAPVTAEIADAPIEYPPHARDAGVRDQRTGGLAAPRGEGYRERQYRPAPRARRRKGADVDADVARDRQAGVRDREIADVRRVRRCHDASALVDGAEPTELAMVVSEAREAGRDVARVERARVDRAGKAPQLAYVLGEDQVQLVDAVRGGECERASDARHQAIAEAHEADVCDEQPGDRRDGDEAGKPGVRSCRSFRRCHALSFERATRARGAGVVLTEKQRPCAAAADLRPGATAIRK